MKKSGLNLLLISCLIGCKEKNSYSNYMVNIHYVDSLGNNLYTNGQNGYVIDSARLYTLINGKKTLVYLSTPNFVADDPYGIYPYNLAISTNTGLSIQTNEGILDDSTTLIVHLKQGVDDTLACMFANQSVSAAWYNGVQVLDQNIINATGPDFTIQKN